MNESHHRQAAQDAVPPVPPMWPVFRPRVHQYSALGKLARGEVRKAALCWHRKSGKDFACFYLACALAQQEAGNYAYIFPTFAQGRRALWENITNQGVRPPRPSWGAMIASGRDTLVNAPWVAVAPGVALVLVVVGCTLVGDAMREGLGDGRRKKGER